MTLLATAPPLSSVTRLPLAGEAPPPTATPTLAFAAKGFRPFFALAAAFAAAIVPLWLLVLAGVVRPATYLDPTTWHAHEMVTGFAVAVIAGFLLTAVGNWTQRETATGAPLLALAALWTAGRAVMLLAGALPPLVVAGVDLAFLPALMLVLARPLIAARSRRNFVMLAVLGALFAANVVVHLEALGLIAPGSGRRACSSGVDVVVLLIVIIAGRILPGFTRNATGATSIRAIPVLDGVAIASAAAVVLVDALAPNGHAAAVVSAIAAAAIAARTVRWGMRRTFRQPLLWILHVGHAWIPVGLLLRAVSHFDPAVPPSLATHALTAGAIASLTLGMMARVALGHTGRPLAVSAPTTWAFASVTLAAFARVVVPLVAPRAYFAALVVAGCAWTLAFGLYLVVYVPILAAPRVDGKPG